MTVNRPSCKDPIEIPRGTAQQLPKAPAPTALSRLATLPPSSRWRLAGYLAELIQSYDQSEFGLGRLRTEKTVTAAELLQTLTPEDLNRPICDGNERTGRLYLGCKNGGATVSNCLVAY